jgi:putative transposase
VVKYVLAQEEHHKKELFKEEYFDILKNNNVEFKEDYVFDFFNNVYGWE